MPKKLRPEEFGAILHVVGLHPDGVRVSVLEKQLKRAVSHRTLIRRLNELVGQGKLRRQGEGRSLMYVPVSATPSTEAVDKTYGGLTLPALELKAESESYVPLSKAGQEVRDYVRQPIPKRTPVGYKREFLDSYVPNQTFYLPQDIRDHLRAIGRSPSGGRPAGTYARQILDRLLIDLSWASSRLEGNTYSQLDTERLIRFGQVAEGKDAQETQMILNHKSAIEFLVEQAGEIGFNRHTFLNLHALLSEGLLGDPGASGRLRWIPVGVSGTVFHPLTVPQVIEECFRQILDTAAAVADPFEQAFFVMVHIPYLQPFEDVNKRVSRLGANIPLIKNNLSPLSFVDVPERAYIDGTLGVYEINRVELLRDVFVWAYERSVQRYVAVRQSMAQPDPFRLQYREALIEAVATVVRGLMLDVMPALGKYAAKSIPVADRDKFVAMAAGEIGRLHEGTIARFRLRPSEFETWKQARQGAEK